MTGAAFHWSVGQWLWFLLFAAIAITWLGGISVVLYTILDALRTLIRGPEFLRDEYPSRDLPRLPTDERECDE